MADLERRVLDCFANVFPEIARAELDGASQESITGWDSVRHVMLLAALAEEFDFPLDYEAAEEIHSYASAVSFVREQISPATSR